MYVAGRLAEMHETLLESFCLIEGLSRLGFGESNIGVLVTIAKDAHAKRALLAPKVHVGDPIVVVRLSQMVTKRLVSTSEKGEFPVDDANWLAWYGTVGAIPVWPAEEFRARWAREGSIFLEAPRDEAEPVWRRSRSHAILPRLETLLKAQGFVLGKGLS